MGNENLIEIIKVQNELIWLLCNESRLTKMKPKEEGRRLESLIEKLRDFNKQVK